MWWKKNGIVDKFQMDFKNVNPNGGNVAERNSKSMKIFFLENCWNYAYKQGSKFFFSKEMLLVPIKHHFSYLLLH
jgi:hypothetical protein